MADITLRQGRLKGEALIPPSKSIAHRALILSALSGGSTSPLQLSEDILATKDCLAALDENVPQFNCRESGSTLRFMIPLAMALCGGGAFHRAPGLRKRPIGLYPELFPYAVFSDGEPLVISGSLRPQSYRLRGDVSSQFITGLLLALPLLDGDSEIHVLAPFESMAYVELTLDVMHAFGVTVERPTAHDFIIPGNQCYAPCHYEVEGDYSQAAVFLAAAGLGHAVALRGLTPDSSQGDRAMLDILKRMGAKPLFTDGLLTVNAPARLKAVDIDASQCPDIIPMAALLQCLADGESLIYNGARLRIKECDRLSATVHILSALGADIQEDGDTMRIRGVPVLTGGVTLSCQNDHRMAMLLSIAALHAQASVTLAGVECVAKSWPDYFTLFAALGGIQP